MKGCLIDRQTKMGGGRTETLKNMGEGLEDWNFEEQGRRIGGKNWNFLEQGRRIEGTGIEGTGTPEREDISL